MQINGKGWKGGGVRLGRDIGWGVKGLDLGGVSPGKVFGEGTRTWGGGCVALSRIYLQA